MELEGGGWEVEGEAGGGGWGGRWEVRGGRGEVGGRCGSIRYSVKVLLKRP